MSKFLSVYQCKRCERTLGYLVIEDGWVYLQMGAGQPLAHKSKLWCSCGNVQNFSRYEVTASIST